MPFTTTKPVGLFTDINGKPLDGQVFFGQPNLDPIANPITVYWDAAGTQPVTQPVVTVGGYPMNGSTRSNVFVNADYSILVRNRNGFTVFSAPNLPFEDSSDNQYFLQAGSGAVQRTVQSKLRDVVSVKDFGAVGDGVADDTVAIQAALDSGARVVELSNGGTHLVSSMLTVPANVQLAGNGATLQAASAFVLLDFANGGGISNTTLIGSVAAGVYNAASIGIKADGVNNHPAAPTYITGPKVENCVIRNFGFDGVQLAYVKKAEIRNNRISNIGYAAIAGVSCEDIIVDGNTIEDVTPGSGPAGDVYGIFIDRENGLSETSDPRSYRCVITNNIVKNVVLSGGPSGHAINTHAGIDFLIDGNIISGCQYGIVVTSSVIGALGQQLGPLRCVVSSNTLAGTVGYGILVNGANNAGVLVEHARDCVISNNTILGFGAPGDSSIGAVQLQYTKDITVTGNVIKESRVNCISLNGPNIGLNIIGNVMVDPFDNAATAPSCIRVLANDCRGYIGNNTFRYENGSLGTNVAENAVRIELGKTGLDIDFGRSTFQGIDATHLAFLALTTSGVRNTGMEVQSGSSTIVVGSGLADGIDTVDFAKRFPYVPKVTVTLRRPFNQGGKFPILGIDTAVAIDQTRFRIYALPYDGTTWTATGSLSYDWVAQ
jgi:hypothetical protein